MILSAARRMKYIRACVIMGRRKIKQERKRGDHGDVYGKSPTVWTRKRLVLCFCTGCAKQAAWASRGPRADSGNRKNRQFMLANIAAADGWRNAFHRLARESARKGKAVSRNGGYPVFWNENKKWFWFFPQSVEMTPKFMHQSFSGNKVTQLFSTSKRVKEIQ